MMAKVGRANVLSKIDVPLALQRGSAAGRYGSKAVEFAQERGLGEAQWVFDVVALDETPSANLRVGGEVLHAPRLLPESGELSALAFGACTLGSTVSDHVAALFAERRISLALALDRLGNEMLLEASRLLQDSILASVRRRGLTMAGELRPGDPGLALNSQPTVLRLAGASAIGLHCSTGMALTPLKSTSVVYGVGRNLPAVTWSRCDDCRSRATCRLAGRAAA